MHKTIVFIVILYTTVKSKQNKYYGYLYTNNKIKKKEYLFVSLYLSAWSHFS